MPRQREWEKKKQLKRVQCECICFFRISKNTLKAPNWNRMKEEETNAKQKRSLNVVIKHFSLRAQNKVIYG